jgi:hypothetical protein
MSNLTIALYHGGEIAPPNVSFFDTLKNYATI